MWDFFLSNWLGIVLATIAAMAIGTVWYAKPVFGKVWQKEVGLKDSEMNKGMAKGMIIMLVMAFVSAFVLKRFIVIAAPLSYWQAIKVALWIWLGFVFTYTVGSGVFERRSPKLMALNLGNQLVTLVVMAAIVFAIN